MNLYENINKNLKENEIDEKSVEYESDIDHFIERGNVFIPVRKGETDEEVLRHLEKLGSGFTVEPTEEEKASGKYIQKQVYTYPNQAGGLCTFEWVRNPNYMGESEEGNDNAKRVIDEFTKSKRTKDIYFKALDRISQLEYENYIDKDKYDECIKQLQDLYNKRNRNIKESTNNKEWEEVCKVFCKKIGAELLFVNDDSFGYETKDGQLVHLYADELEQMLKSSGLKESLNEAVELGYDDYYAFGTEDNEDAVFCNNCGQPVKPEFCYVEDEEDPNSEIYCWRCHDDLVAKGIIRDDNLS